MGAPRFGTQANGNYQVFCVWADRPDRIREARLARELAQSGEAVILMYFNTLSKMEREDLMRSTWKDGSSVPILDETLFDFLTQIYGDRFRNFLEASLPYTATNPYNPETDFGLRVAPEMFYGREQLADDIEAITGGTSILFGGRQLGKTVLLRHVEERFHQPELRNYAWFVDLKAEGYVARSERDPHDIFDILFERFTRDNILDPEAQPRSPQDVRRSIQNKFEHNRQLRVLAMFDEADSFLVLDGEKQFEVVEALRALMNSTSNRFKVVFAGLHSVQRYAYAPNTPFYNLGFNRNTPRRGGIGPLRDGEARQLVEDPSYLLGFRFQPAAVSRLLSYTIRHPALIQFFCHELIETYRRDHSDQNQNPPFKIGTDIVDKVYNHQNIRNEIKRRFEATFELDPKYQVISLAMIFDQERERPPERWSLDRIRESCESYCPQTFNCENLSDLDLRSLLDELIGLGILAPDGDLYRIRSSLIAQMFGNGEDVMAELGRLGDSEPFLV